MSAIQLLTKACEYDAAGRRLEALKLYEDGIRELLQMCKSEPDPSRKVHYQTKIKEYIDRAEVIKQNIQKASTKGEVVDRIHILEGASGYGYNRIFGKYLNNDVREIEIEEPYLREHYQLINLTVFLELAVKKCTNLKYVKLVTTTDKRPHAEQMTALRNIQEDLQERNIKLSLEFPENLHDRQITFSNGFIVKIGRGLHFFRPINKKFCLGSNDFDYRKCLETHVDIFKCMQ